MPERVARVVDDRVLDAQALERGGERLAVAGEAESRRVDAEGRQARVAVALVPGDHVGEGAQAVELGEVEEVDQHRPGGRQLGERGVALGAEPAQPSGGSGGAAMSSDRGAGRGS